MNIEKQLESSETKELETPFELENIQKNLDKLKFILKETISSCSELKGSVTVQQLQEQFEESKGLDFKGEDGYYELIGNGELNEGDLIKVESEAGQKTLWYPAKPEDLKMLFKDLGRTIFDRAVNQLRLREGNTKRPYYDYENEEKKIWGKYQFIDFGCGDGRAAIIASIFGIPATGLEIDHEMANIARKNINEIKAQEIPSVSVTIKEGSFLDNEIIKDLIGEGNNRKPTLFYSYVTPMTGQLLEAIKPYLKDGDFILIYRERIGSHPEFEEGMRGILKKELEVNNFFGGAVNIYSINRKEFVQS